MHYHLEIIMPPMGGFKEIQEAIKNIMAPFDENGEDEDGNLNRYAFWDYYIIGGRYAGYKLRNKLGDENIEKFIEWIESEGITVSSFQAGKHSLEPKSQIPKVDAKWNEFFPRKDGKIVACPLFDHSNNQYEDEIIDGDISRLADSLDVKCQRIIFAVPGFLDKEVDKFSGPLEPEYMITTDLYNGVNWMPVQWDGTIRDAIEKHKEKLQHASEAFLKAAMPQDDWICVTVDYHS